jgi:hypothetical protein
MAGFTSLDDIVSEVTVGGKFFRSDWQKSMLPTTAATAGEWSFLARGAGNPGADTIYNAGTNLTWQQVKDSTSGVSSIQHGGDVTPDYKHILNASAFTAAATTAPCIMMLVDVLGFYRVTSVTTTTSQATTNTLVAFSTFTANAGTDICTHTNINLLNYSTVQFSTTTTLPAGLTAATNYFIVKQSDTTFKVASSYANAVAGTTIDITDAGTGTHTINTLLPRYTDGAGVQAFMWNTNATALGAATPNLSLASYTNSVATAAKVTPGVLPIGKTAAANGLVLYSGTGSGKYGPFMPLAAGDRGIRSVENIQISASYLSGEFSVALAKPILTLPITTLGVASERDLLNQMPSLPRVFDGACLMWMIYHGAATPINSAIYGHLDLGWG